MPRIRKETSNRRSTNDRAKRRKQVKESKRKSAKAAKKSVQWKSKTPKDPGIPSEFPYKDQILAEVAEQRRKDAEEKEKKKADKQRSIAKARALARGEPWESDNEEQEQSGSEDEEGGEGKSKATSKDLNVGIESIAALSAKHIGNELKPRPKVAVEESEEEEEDEVPVLVNRDLPNLKSVLEKADVVLEVLDARDPMAYRSKHVEELALELGKKVLFVLNKIDTCPREAVAQWSTHLRVQHPTFIFRSATPFLPEAPVQAVPKAKKGKGRAPKAPTGDAVGADQVLSCLSQWAKAKKGTEPLAVAVVGVTNVGKSALINSLLKRSALPVYTLASSSRGPTTTDLPQEVEIETDGQKILVIDTPGLSFTSGEEEDPAATEAYRARDILLRSKGRIDRLRDPNPPIAQIVARANVEDLMLLYSLPAFVGGDPTSFLSGVARANQLVKKKGELDLTGAARIVLRDWSIGKLAHFTLPPSGKSKASTEEPPSAPKSDTPTQLYANDDTLLAALPTRKERRKAGGLVKLIASKTTDERQAQVEQEWIALRDAADEESDDDDEQPEDDDAEVMDVNSEEEEEEDEDEQDREEEEEEEEEQDTPPPAPVSNKQKRKRAAESQPTRPSKKVAFAPALSSKSKSGAKSEPTQQKKPAKAGAPAILKKPIAVKAAESATSSKGDVNAKTANKPSAKKAVSSGGKKEKDASTRGEEAYDFGKFF